MRILITGSSGMLGSALVEILSTEHQVFGTGTSEHSPQFGEYLQFDLLSENYDDLMSWSQPDIVIHCAALTNGNYCAENAEEAFLVNGFSVKKILDSTEDSVPVIYISTDAVFSSNSHMSVEDDCKKPESVYGKSKELGEFFLENSSRNSLILRTTIVGYHKNSRKNSFAEWIINSCENNQEISLFDDVLFTPISIWEFGNEILHLISKGINSLKVYHLSGKEACSKYEFGIRLLEVLGLSSKKVLKGYITSFTDRNKRATDQSLDSSHYERENRRDLPIIADTLQQIKERYYESNSTGV